MLYVLVPVLLLLKYKKPKKCVELKEIYQHENNKNGLFLFLHFIKTNRKLILFNIVGHSIVKYPLFKIFLKIVHIF